MALAEILVLTQEVKALLVELLHEVKAGNDVARTQCEIERKLALKLEKITLQVHVIAVQMGRVLSAVETRVERGNA